ncbi:MAG TPA: hypothetical protein VHW92_04045 [Mycobacteriales bacterium]|jgi:hypothetical protein|nr:hypothetical protein [Mycobacteriales bacterium]
MGASPVADPFRYAEDRVGLTARVWACVAAPILVQLVVCLTTPVSVWGAVLGGTAALEVFALVLVHQCWETGIRVTAAEVRIGGCRRAERLAAKGRAPKSVVDPHFRLRTQFRVPIRAVRSARVLRRPQFDELPGKVITPAGQGRAVKRFGFVDLVSPLASAAALLEVDLERADMPAMSTYLVERLAPTRSTSRYLVTNRWTVATRHPEALSDALTRVGIPVTPADASALAVPDR